MTLVEEFFKRYIYFEVILFIFFFLHVFLSSFNAMLAAGRIHNLYILMKRPVPIQSLFFLERRTTNVFFQIVFSSREEYFEWEREKKKVTTVGERSENRSEMRKYIHMKQFPWKWNEYMVFIFGCIIRRNISSTQFPIYVYLLLFFFVCLCRFAGCHWDYRFRWKICNSMEKNKHTHTSTNHTMVFWTRKRIQY